MSKLIDADGEQQETQHWVDSAYDCGYLTEEQARSLNSELCEIGRMLNGMVQKAESFCGEAPPGVRESAGEYFSDSTDD